MYTWWCCIEIFNWNFVNCPWYGTQLSLASEILIVKLIVNNNMYSAPIIRRQVLHVFIFHPIGFEALATMLISVNMFRKLVLQSFPSRDVSAPGSPFRILGCTCCYHTSALGRSCFPVSATSDLPWFMFSSLKVTTSSGPPASRFNSTGDVGPMWINAILLVGDVKGAIWPYPTTTCFISTNVEILNPIPRPT